MKNSSFGGQFIKQYVVDAFTDKVFHGNQAAVCVLDAWLPDERMMDITRENNFSETAFTVREDEKYHLRWFTPGGEIDLCGHATLGTAFVLLNFYEARQQEKDTLLLSTLRGLLPIGFALLFQWAAPEKFFFLYLLTEAVTLAVFGIYKRLAPRAPFDRERVFRKTIYSKGTEISETTEQIEAFCERWEIPARQQYIAQMAVEELCVATLDNGFSGKEDGFFQITLAVQEEGSLEVHIRDNADSFNPFAMEMNSSAADDDADLAALGVVTIKKKAKEFSYRHYQGFNTVILRL